ncbi:MAG: hypothetical protein AAF604_22585, partial [Acidobacteriota bacterium]
MMLRPRHSLRLAGLGASLLLTIPLLAATPQSTPPKKATPEKATQDVATPENATPGNATASLEGLWQGSLSLPGGTTLRLQIELEQKSGGAFRGRMRSPDQGNMSFPIDQVEIADQQVDLTVEGVGGRRDGPRGSGPQTRAGTGSQGGGGGN